jgi:hypothetical protein
LKFKTDVRPDTAAGRVPDMLVAYKLMSVIALPEHVTPKMAGLHGSPTPPPVTKLA